MKKLKRVFSMFLALALLLGAVPTTFIPGLSRNVYAATIAPGTNLLAGTAYTTGGAAVTVDPSFESTTTSPFYSVNASSNGGSQSLVTISGPNGTTKAVEFSDSNSVGGTAATLFKLDYKAGTNNIVDRFNQVLSMPAGSAPVYFYLSYKVERRSANGSANMAIQNANYATIELSGFDATKNVPRFCTANPYNTTTVPTMYNISAYQQVQIPGNEILGTVDYTSNGLSTYRFAIYPNGGTKTITGASLEFNLRADSTGPAEAYAIDDISLLETSIIPGTNLLAGAAYSSGGAVVTVDPSFESTTTSPFYSSNATANGGSQNLVSVAGPNGTTKAVEFADSNSVGSANASLFRLDYKAGSNNLVDRLNQVLSMPAGSDPVYFYFSYKVERRSASGTVNTAIQNANYATIELAPYDTTKNLPRFVTGSPSIYNTPAYQHDEPAGSEVLELVDSNTNGLSTYRFPIYPNGGTKLLNNAALEFQVRADSTGPAEAYAIDDISLVEDQSDPVSISFIPSSYSLEIGTSRNTVVNATYQNGTSADVTAISKFFSSNPSVITVDQNTGLMTAVAVGSASITATCKGQSTTAGVNVTWPSAPPSASLTTPASTTNVSSGTDVVLTFNKPIDQSKLTTQYFVLKYKNTGAAVSTTLSTDTTKSIITLHPSYILMPNTTYTIVIDDAVTDVAGQPVIGIKSWDFTTAMDNSPPTASLTNPLSLTSVLIYKNIVLTFSEPMNVTTITPQNITLKETSTGAAVTGTYSLDTTGTVLTIKPSAYLKPGTSYTLDINSSVTDLAATPVTGTVNWVFTTAPQDTVLPTAAIAYTIPALQSGIDVDTSFIINFSEPMEPDTLNAANFVLKQTDTGSVVSTTYAVNSQNTAVTITPASRLAFGKSLELTVGNSVIDLGGNPVSGTNSFVFNTIASSPNLAIGKKATATSIITAGHSEINAIDGNIASYYESQYTLPQSFTLDLGTRYAVRKVIIKEATTWNGSPTTYLIEGSTDGTTFTTLKPAASYQFSMAANSNTVPITFSTANIRYVRVTCTANTPRTSLTMAEFEVYSDPDAPDLVLNDFSWTPQSPTSSDTVKFTATVTNQGLNATPQGVPFRVSYQADGKTVATSLNYTNSVAPGETVVLTGETDWVNPPSFNYNVTAVVDSDGNIGEINEDNNFMIKPINVSGDIWSYNMSIEENLQIYDFPEELLSYYITFPADTIKKEHLKLLQNGVDQPLEYQLSGVAEDSNGYLMSATLNFRTDLWQGAVKKFSFTYDPNYIAADNFVNHVTLTDNNDGTATIYSGAVTSIPDPPPGRDAGSSTPPPDPMEQYVKVPFGEVNYSTPAAASTVFAPIISTAYKADAWIGDGSFAAPDNIKVVKIKGYPVEQGPLFMKYRVEYTFTEGRQYNVELTTRYRDGYTTVDEYYSGFGSADNVYFKFSYKRGIDPNGRLELGNQNYIKMLDDNSGLRFGFYSGNYNMGVPQVNGVYDGQLPYEVGLYAVNSGPLTHGTTFWNDSGDSGISFVTYRLRDWKTEQRIYYSSVGLKQQLQFFDSQGDKYMQTRIEGSERHWAMSVMPRAAVALYGRSIKNLGRTNVNLYLTTPVDSNFSDPGLAPGVEQYGVGPEQRLWKKLTDFSLNKYKDMIFDFPEDVNQKLPMPSVDNTDISSPNDFWTTYSYGINWNYYYLAIKSWDISGQIDAPGWGGRDQKKYYSDYAYNRWKWTDASRKRERSLLVFLAYCAEDDNAHPHNSMIGGNANFTVEHKQILGLASGAFPQHPAAAKWKSEYMKFYNEFLDYFDRKSVPEKNTLAGRWYENVACYAATTLEGFLIAAKGFRIYDGSSILDNPQAQDFVSWWMNTMAPVENVVQGGPVSRYSPPMGAHGDNTRPDGLYEDLFVELSRELMLSDKTKTLGEGLLWCATSGREGVKPDLKSALYTDYGPVMRYDFGGPHEAYLDLQQLNGSGYRWTGATNGQIYYSAKGRKWSWNTSEDNGDAIIYNNISALNANGSSLGNHATDEVLYNFDFAQYYKALGSNSSYLSRGVMMLRDDYIAVYDNVLDDTVGNTFNWTNRETGVKFEYYNDTSFTDLKYVRSNAQRFPFEQAWATGQTPFPEITSSSFSIRGTSNLNALSTGTYTFYTSASNGAMGAGDSEKLWIGNTLVLDTAKGVKSGTIALTAGNSYPLKVEYIHADSSKPANLFVRYATPTAAINGIESAAVLYSKLEMPSIYTIKGDNDGVPATGDQFHLVAPQQINVTSKNNYSIVEGVFGPEYVFASDTAMDITDGQAVFNGTTGYTRDGQLALFQGTKIGLNGFTIERSNGDFGFSAEKIDSNNITGKIAGKAGGTITITPPTGFDLTGKIVKVNGQAVQSNVENGTISFNVDISQAEGVKTYTIGPVADGVDLKVTDVSFAYPDKSNVNNVVFSAVVVNQGTVATTAGSDIKVDFQVDGGQTVSWSSGNTVSIAPGQSVTLTANGGPAGINTWTTSAGNHTLTAVVDSANIVVETDETNNQFSKQINVYNSNIVITHTPVTSVSPTDGAAITADIDDVVDVNASVYYKYEDGTNPGFIALNMTKVTGNTYSAQIPGSPKGSLVYYIKAQDILGNTKTSMFADDFTDSAYTAKYWSDTTKWSIVKTGDKNSLSTSQSSSNLNRLSNVDLSSMKDYDFEFDAKYSAKLDINATIVPYGSFYFRDSKGDLSNTYAIETRAAADPNNVTIKALAWNPSIAGGYALLGNSVDYTYDPTQWHHYKISTKGNTFTLFIDGIKILSASDANNYFPAGAIGFKSYFAGMNVSNVTVAYSPMTVDTTQDLTPPAISSVPLTTVDASTGATVTADIQDSSLVSAKLFYRYDNETAFTPVIMTNTTGTTYTGQLPGTGTGTTLSYYISATDSAGNKSTYPFADDFQNSSYSGSQWTIKVPASWSIVTEGTSKYMQTTSTATFLSNTPAASLTDYDYEFDGRYLSKTTGKAYYFFRANGGNYYAIEGGVSGTNNVLFKMHWWKNDTYQSNITSNVTYTYDPTQWHSYKIQVRGNVFTLFIDGVKVISGTDTANSYTSGYVGFKSVSVGLQVDNVRVVNPPVKVTGATNLLINMKNPVTRVAFNADIPVNNSVTDTGSSVTESVYYKYDSGNYQTMSVSQATDKNFNLSIPGSNHNSLLTYYIKATDGLGNTSSTAEATVTLDPFVPYSNDFEGNVDGTVPTGWAVSDNTRVKVVTLPDGTKAFNISGDPSKNQYAELVDEKYRNLDNVSVKFKAKYSQVGTNFLNIWRMMYRAQDDSNYYDLEWGTHNNKYFLLRKTTLGGNYYLANYVKSLLNDWHDYELQISGVNHKLFIDGVLVASGDDYSSLGFDKGYIKFMTIAGINLYVDNFSIQQLDNPYTYKVQPTGNYTGIYSVGQTIGLDVNINNYAKPHDYTVSYSVYNAEGNQELVAYGSKTFSLAIDQNLADTVAFDPNITKIGTYDVVSSLYVDNVLVPDQTKKMRMTVVNNLANVSNVDLDNESIFGFNTHYALNWLDDVIDGVRKVGGRVIRHGLSWGQVDSNSQNPDGTMNYNYSTFDQEYNKLTSYGFNLIPVLDVSTNGSYVPNMANTPEALKAIERFVKDTAARYSGKIRQWETPNEPEISFKPEYIPVESVDLQKSTYLGLKNADVNNVLVSGDHTSSVLSTLPKELALGSYDYTDAYSYHPYIYGAMPDGNLQKIVNDVKGLVNNYGGWKDYYLTEGGWPTATAGYPSVSEAWQRDYIVRSYLIDMTMDQVKTWEYYDYKNDGTDSRYYDVFWGITDNDGRPKLAYSAVNNLMTTLDKVQFVGLLNTGDDSVVAEVFIKDGQPIIAAWKKVSHLDDPSVTPATSILSIPTQNGQITVKDINGNLSTVSAAGGFVNVTVSSSPVYIMNVGNDVVYSSAKILLSNKYNDAYAKINSLNTTDASQLGIIKANIEAALDDTNLSSKAAGLEKGITDIYALMSTMASEVKAQSIDSVKAYVAMEALYNYAESVSKSLIQVKYEQGITSAAIDYGSTLDTTRTLYNTTIGSYGIMPVSTSALMRANRYGRLAETNNGRGDFAVAYVYNFLAKSFAGTVSSIIGSEPVKFSGVMTNVTPNKATSEASGSVDATIALTNRTASSQSATVEITLPTGWGTVNPISFDNMSAGSITRQTYTINVPSGTIKGLYTVNVKTKVGNEVVDSRDITLNIDNAIGVRIMPLTQSVDQASQVTVRLTGTTVDPKSGKIKLKGPDGNLLTPVTTDTFAGLAQGQTLDLAFNWTYHTANDYNEYICNLLVTDTAGSKELFSDPAVPIDFNLTQKADTNMTIDGSLNDWKDAYPVHLRGNERNSTGYYDKNNLDAVAYTKWDADNFYIAVKVTDDIHKQSETPSNLWKNDSVQITIDPLNDKSSTYSSDDMEWGFALNNDGTKYVYIFSSNSPNPNGDVSGQVSFNAIRDDVNKNTFYEIKIPKSMINQFPALENSLIGWDVLVNDADYQNGRDNSVNWTKGLGDSKNPSLYDSFKLVNVPVAYEPLKSTDATLSSLSLSGGYSVTPAFAPNVTSYTLTVPNSTTDMSITPTVTSSVYKSMDVTVNGTPVTPNAGAYQANLAVGANNIAITVTAEDGTITMTYTVTITRQDASAGTGGTTPGSTDGETTPGNNDNGGGAETAPSPTPTDTNTDSGYSITVSALNGTKTITPTIVTGNDGKTVIIIEVPKIDGAPAYTINLPIELLKKGDPTSKLEVKTELGTFTIPYSRLLKQFESAGEISFTIFNGDKSVLKQDVKEDIGSRPFIGLSLNADGKKIEYNNRDLPVTVEVPYKPTAEELQNPEHIVVMSVDKFGNTVPIPNGRYNPSKGTVTFTSTILTQFAIEYVFKSFEDIKDYGWAKDSIEVLASKGIINGTGKTEFTPEANITRADFIVLLMKALGLTAKTDTNFDDIGKDAYYYNAVGAAKELGITSGSGNNLFNPAEQITRQDMMTLAAKALRTVNKLNTSGTAMDLAKFTDSKLVESYATENIAAMVKEGLVTGDGSRLNPYGTATRAEVAVLIYRIYNK